MTLSFCGQEDKKNEFKTDMLMSKSSPKPIISHDELCSPLFLFYVDNLLYSSILPFTVHVFVSVKLLQHWYDPLILKNIEYIEFLN